MTRLGAFLQKKSVKQAEIAKKTGISKSRISLLCNDSKTKLTCKELYLIALAIDIDPKDAFESIYHGLELLNN